jgi:hypothetical protein
VLVPMCSKTQDFQTFPDQVAESASTVPQGCKTAGFIARHFHGIRKQVLHQ